MQIYVAFGLPGSGKTFIGKIFQKNFDYYFFDGDQDLSDEMKQAIQKRAVVTNDMRNAFFRALMKSVKEIALKYDKIIIAQTFIKEKHRNQFLSEFPDAKFILVKTTMVIQESRLIKRGSNSLNLEYLKKMYLNFDKPQIDYKVINNNTEGKESVKEQIQKLLNLK